MTEIQETFMIAELIKTLAELRETSEALTAAIQNLTTEGLPQTLPRTLNADQAAEFCQVEPATIRNWASRGKIPYHKANGSMFFVVNELLEWSSKGYDGCTRAVASSGRK